MNRSYLLTFFCLLSFDFPWSAAAGACGNNEELHAAQRQTAEWVCERCWAQQTARSPLRHPPSHYASAPTGGCLLYSFFLFCFLVFIALLFYSINLPICKYLKKSILPQFCLVIEIYIKIFFFRIHNENKHNDMRTNIILTFYTFSLP